jgi:hypothetical protein
MLAAVTAPPSPASRPVPCLPPTPFTHTMRQPTCSRSQPVLLPGWRHAAVYQQLAAAVKLPVLQLAGVFLLRIGLRPSRCAPPLPVRQSNYSMLSQCCCQDGRILLSTICSSLQANCRLSYLLEIGPDFTSTAMWQPTCIRFNQCCCQDGHNPAVNHLLASALRTDG